MRAMALIDHAKEVAIGICEHDEIGVVRVDPVHPSGAQRKEAFDLGLRACLISLDEQVQVRAVVRVQMQQRAVTGAGPKKVRARSDRFVSEGIRPERLGAFDVCDVQDDRANSQHSKKMARPSTRWEAPFRRLGAARSVVQRESWGVLEHAVGREQRCADVDCRRRDPKVVAVAAGV